MALIYLVIPTYLSADFSSNTFKDEDGSWSEDKYRDKGNYKSKQIFWNAQRDVANYYHIPILEMENNAGISITNIENFYPTSNVHPNENGYNRYAETILKLL